MVWTKAIHGLVLAGGVATAALTCSAIQAHQGYNGWRCPEDNTELALYTAQVAASAVAVYGGVFLYYDIESERKKKREERKREERKN